MEGHDMAEKKNERKNNGVIRIMGKHLLAAQRFASKEEGRPILRGVHLTAGEYGRWKLDATDSYKLIRIEGRDDTAVKATDIDIVVPPEALLGVKAGDSVTFEPSADGTTCKVYRFNKRSGEVVSEVRCTEGKYPNVEKLLPEKEIPRGCYRFVPAVNPGYVKDAMQSIAQSVGDGPVEVATFEDEDKRPVMLYAGNEDVRVTALVMPIRPTSWMEKHSPLADARPKGKAEERNRELREELKKAQANADMWKDMYGKLEEKQGEVVDKGGDAVKLAEELEKVKAERDRFAEKFRVEKAKRLEQKGDKLEERIKKLESVVQAATAELKDEVAKREKAEADLKAAHKELDAVWKENAHLKAKKPQEVPPAPKAPKAERHEETAAAVSLETIRKWCEGKGLIVSQKREGCCIWVEGESTAYKDELAAMGLRFSKKRKSWYINPAA